MIATELIERSTEAPMLRLATLGLMAMKTMRHDDDRGEQAAHPEREVDARVGGGVRPAVAAGRRRWSCRIPAVSASVQSKEGRRAARPGLHGCRSLLLAHGVVEFLARLRHVVEEHRP